MSCFHDKEIIRLSGKRLISKVSKKKIAFTEFKGT